jgi:hypothetical protein
MIHLLHDAEGRARLGQRGRERMLHDYTLPVIAGRLRELYGQLTSAPSLNRALTTARSRSA